ncbi:MAG: protein phosphatase 2C domain-containing protein [Bacteroidales bacterium]|jgi:protein phosphatase
MKLSLFGNTSVGRQRDHNEDAYLIFCNIDKNWVEVNNLEVDTQNSNGLVFVIADGMGGANAGEVASEIAINTVKERISKISFVPKDTVEIEKLLSLIVLEGHNKIIKASRHNKVMQGMGTTIVIGYIFKDTLCVEWCGDSRCYVYNKNFDKELVPFTDDHSLVWDRVKNKEITPEEARLSEDSNLILQSLGGTLQRPEPGFKWMKLKNNDRILFCSDGLNSMLSNIGIQQILDFNSTSQETCASLIQSANNAGGRDNITSIVIDVVDIGEEKIESDINQSKTQVKKRKPYIFVVLLILILIIAAGIYFRQEIANVFLARVVRDSSLAIHDSALNNPAELNKHNSSLNLKQDTVVTDKDSIFYSDQKVKNSHLVSNDKIRIDSSNIEVHMREAINKIVSIKNSISMIKPGGAIYNSNFYDENKANLDSIQANISIQEELIKTVVILNADNYVIKVTDYRKANEIYKKIKKTLSELEKRTNEIINR